MKKKWHIKTRIMVTLMGLTCSMLLVVALAFNLSIRSYIRSRVSNQLTSVIKNASEERKAGSRGSKGGGRRFDERTDRITGTKGNAVVMDKKGNLLSVLRDDDNAGAELAEYLCSGDISEQIQNKVLSVDSGTYAVSVVSDPKDEEQYLLVYVDVTSLMALTDRMNLFLFIVTLAAILLSIFLSIRFARSLSDPVHDLSAFAEEIGQGNLATRELDFHDVEFDNLAGSMNRMADELRKAKQTQEIFFQNMSHELRTPLTSIRGNAEGIVYGIMEPHNAAKIILSESEKLGGMVEDILYLSRMGKTTPDNDVQPLDLREILSLCVSEQRLAAESRGITFNFDFDDLPVMLSIREQDAQRLFGNIISNAIRYAEREILLSCHTKGETAVTLIADDGPGISDEDLPHIFERFYKGKDGKHGIGLAIAKSVAEAYNGNLTAGNRPDGGAVFEVRLSLTRYNL